MLSIVSILQISIYDKSYKLWSLVVQDNNFAKKPKVMNFRHYTRRSSVQSSCSSLSLDHCWCDFTGHVTCDRISLLIKLIKNLFFEFSEWKPKNLRRSTYSTCLKSGIDTSFVCVCQDEVPQRIYLFSCSYPTNSTIV